MSMFLFLGGMLIYDACYFVAFILLVFLRLEQGHVINIFSILKKKVKCVFGPYKYVNFRFSPSKKILQLLVLQSSLLVSHLK